MHRIVFQLLMLMHDGRSSGLDRGSKLKDRGSRVWLVTIAFVLAVGWARRMARN